MDVSGNVFITGSFAGTVDFDPNSGTVNRTAKGEEDIFVMKLNSQGNFKWVKTIGGSDQDFGNTIRTDKFGNVYVGGGFEDAVDFDPGPANVPLYAFSFEPDGFVLRLDSMGNFKWVIHIGRDSVEKPDFCWTLEVDANGNVYANGGFSDTVDFDPGSGTYYLNGDYSDSYVAKYRQPDLASVVQATSSRSMDFIIYPNPSADGLVTLRGSHALKDAAITLLNFAGQRIQQWKCDSGHAFELDISTVVSGTYIFEIAQDNQPREYVRFIKK